MHRRKMQPNSEKFIYTASNKIKRGIKIADEKKWIA